VHSITGHNFETTHPSDDSDQVWFPVMFGSDLSHQPTIASFPKGFVATGWNINIFFQNCMNCFF
jgi:hypothetical protein